MPGWTQEGNALSRVQTFSTYREALNFVYQVGLAAEENDHHPDMVMNYSRVTVRFFTHLDNGITELDFKMAETVERLIERYYQPPLPN